MGRLFALDPTQGQRYLGVACVTNPTDDDAHRSVDWYLESTTSYVAARVHDTDLQAALQPIAVHTEGADVVLPAGVLTAVTGWIDTDGYSSVLLHLENRGANPVTYVEARWSERAAGTWPFRVGLAAIPVAAEGATFCLSATAAAAWGSPGVKARYCQLQVISNLGSTGRVWTILRRGGATGAS